MESEGDPEGQPFIAVALVPRTPREEPSPQPALGMRRVQTTAFALALFACVFAAARFRAHWEKPRAEPTQLQNTVGLDVSFGGSNNGVYVGGDDKAKVTVAGRDVVKIQMQGCECGGNGGPGGEVGCCCKNCCAAAAQSSTPPCKSEACATGAWKSTVEKVTSSAQCQPRLLGDFNNFNTLNNMGTQTNIGTQINIGTQNNVQGTQNNVQGTQNIFQGTQDILQGTGTQNILQGTQNNIGGNVHVSDSQGQTYGGDSNGVAVGGDSAGRNEQETKHLI